LAAKANSWSVCERDGREILSLGDQLEVVVMLRTSMKSYSQSNPGEKIGEVESLELKRDKCTGKVTRTSLTAECVILLRRGQMLEAVRVW
jgi:hypothetical protein